MRYIQKIVLVIIILILALVYVSLFVVKQTQQAIVLRLGKIEETAKGQPIIFNPGLHFRIPFITQVKKFDMRLKTLNINSSRIVTVEQKDVIVDAFVKWRIGDIVAYYKATGGNISRADNLLMQKVSDGLRAEFGKQSILELVSGQRTHVMQTLRENTNEVAKPLGISVIDVRIKKIDLPEEVTTSVYARMRSNREKEASLIRAQGKEIAEKIKSEADADVIVILSKSNKEAAIIKAEGNKVAARTYARTYQSNLKFYDFYQSLEAYKKAFLQRHQPITLVLQPKGAFFDNFSQFAGQQNNANPANGEDKRQ